MQCPHSVSSLPAHSATGKELLVAGHDHFADTAVNLDHRGRENHVLRHHFQIIAKPPAFRLVRRLPKILYKGAAYRSHCQNRVRVPDQGLFVYVHRCNDRGTPAVSAGLYAFFGAAPVYEHRRHSLSQNYVY